MPWQTNEKKSWEDRKHGVNTKISRAVAQFIREGDIIAIYVSQSEASRQTRIPQANITQACNGKREHAGGYIWKHIDIKGGTDWLEIKKQEKDL
jgi:hypothetical protein